VTTTITHVILSADFPYLFLFFFFFTDPATTEIYTLSLHDALPISVMTAIAPRAGRRGSLGPSWGHERDPGHPSLQDGRRLGVRRSEEHTSELQSRGHLVCRLLLEKKKTKTCWLDERNLSRI